MDQLWQTEFADAFDGRTVLVTGATGFAGHALCRALRLLGARVHGLARSAGESAAGVIPWSVDLRDAAGVEDACKRIAPEYVFHLAAQVTARQELDLVRTMCEHNLIGTMNLLLAVVNLNCRRIIATGTPEEPADDVRRAVVASPYAAAKTAATIYTRMFHRLYRLPVVTVRPFLTYGPRQEENKLVPYTILKLLRGESPQLTSGKRMCDFVYVRDVVRGMLRAALTPGIEGQTFDLGTGQPMSIRMAVECIAKMTGREAPVLFGAIGDRLGEGPLIADAETTRKVLGWEPRWTLAVGLMETIAWFAAKIGVEGFTPGQEKRCA
ncbi:MAG TPA: NAD(P)-dependent oxidoreductase [Pirellulales bacterium]|jgi:nucleoside-diphosphate-sugar epimerase|nr:NAD(P)-dependent oxidoreductase [Pirellulales bacterium]